MKEEVDTIVNSFYSLGFDGELIYVDSVKQAQELEALVTIVSTAPNFSPKEPREMLARKPTKIFLAKEKKGYMLEMCYRPKPRTGFYELAEKAWWKVLSGTELTIYQGVAQQVLWTETPLEQFDLTEANRVVKQERLKH